MSAQSSQLVDVAVDSLIVDESENHRVNYAEVDLLAASIESDGIISPITVVPDGDTGKYRVVAGFRRVKAAQRVGLDVIPAVVRHNLTQSGALLVQFSENIFRNNLSPYETAIALQRIVDSGVTREELSKRVSKSPSWISGYLGLFDLPKSIQEMAKKDLLTVTHIRFLHGQKTRYSESELVRLASEIQNKSQTELTAFKDKLDAKRLGMTVEAYRNTGKTTATQQPSTPVTTVTSIPTKSVSSETLAAVTAERAGNIHTTDTNAEDTSAEVVASPGIQDLEAISETFSYVPPEAESDDGEVTGRVYSALTLKSYDVTTDPTPLRNKTTVVRTLQELYDMPPMEDERAKAIWIGRVDALRWVLGDINVEDLT